MNLHKVKVYLTLVLTFDWILRALLTTLLQAYHPAGVLIQWKHQCFSSFKIALSDCLTDKQPDALHIPFLNHKRACKEIGNIIWARLLCSIIYLCFIILFLCPCAQDEKNQVLTTNIWLQLVRWSYHTLCCRSLRPTFLFFFLFFFESVTALIYGG